MENGANTTKESVKDLIDTLSHLSISANMNPDNAPIIEYMDIKIKEIIRLINKERSAEKRALPISEESTRRYYKDGHVYYKTSAKGYQVKRSDFVDFITELCKIYFPFEDITITTGRRKHAPTVGQIGERFLKDAKYLAENEETSWATYTHKKSKWNKYIKDSGFAKLPIEKVTYPDVKNFYRSITSGRAIKRENLRGIKTVINGIFNYALNDLGLNVVDPGRVDTNCLKCEVSKKESVYLTEERDKIIAECLKRQDICSKFIILMFCMPVRIGEILGLTWDCVDFENNRILIKREVIRTREDGNNCFKLVEHTKCRTEETQNDERNIPVDSSVMDILRDVKRDFPSDTYVFVNKTGNHLYPSKICDRLRDICSATGVTYRGTHKMRFWCVSAMYEKNIPEHVIMKYAGHKDVSTTRHYNRSRFFDSKNDDEVRNLFAI
ncbi:MAG: site-specific integrase [Lachnospiraceae bacterium]|nr:site-specific integrase [Lachnospiraceae bacterium]